MSKKADLVSGPRQYTSNGSSGAHSSRDNNVNDDDTIFDQTYTSEPPPYSSSIVPCHSNIDHSSHITTVTGFSRLSSALPGIDFSKYAIPEATLSKDGSTVSTYHPSLTSSPSSLVRFVQEQARLPPLPYIHIQGTKFDHLPQRDFDIKINMLSLFIAHQSSHSSQWSYTKLVGDQESAYRGRHNPSTLPTVKGGLDEWARKFCEESSALKSFTLTRQLSNWNTAYIEGQIRSLIASTGYDQPVTIKFPVKYAKVIIYPPKSSQSFFHTIMGPLLEKKRFEIIRAVWPYASLPPAPGAAATGRVCVAQSEEAWWEEWRDVLRWAIVNKRNGWVTVDDIAEYRMAPAPQTSSSYP